MKIIRFMHENKCFYGKLNEDLSIDKILINDYLEFFSDFKCEKTKFSLNDVKLLSPIDAPKQDVICLGINYLEHAKESYKFKGIDFDGQRQDAVYFAKRVNEFKNPNDELVLNGLKLDYECELALILKKDAYKISANFDDYIFGYTILNDVSERAIQNKHKQWYMGKSLENSCPFGPFINTDLTIKQASNLEIKCYVNDELRQNSNTNLLIFDIEYILKELSSYAKLKAGTIISTGTPSGVAMGFTPPKFLKSQDKIECKIENLGSLINYIKVENECSIN